VDGGFAAGTNVKQGEWEGGVCGFGGFDSFSTFCEDLIGKSQK
jgi:hypothetical protein